jgi:hypothetical protein
MSRRRRKNWIDAIKGRTTMAPGVTWQEREIMRKINIAVDEATLAFLSTRAFYRPEGE